MPSLTLIHEQGARLYVRQIVADVSESRDVLCEMSLSCTRAANLEWLPSPSKLGLSGRMLVSHKGTVGLQGLHLKTWLKLRPYRGI